MRNLFDNRYPDGDPPGNTKLVWSGILEETSNYRIHIGYTAGVAYLFKTADGRECVYGNPMNLELKKVHSRGILTSEGYAVPLYRLRHDAYPIPPFLAKKHEIFRDEDTSVAGLKAVKIARAMIDAGIIRFPVRSKEVVEVKRQVSGEDVICRIFHDGYSIQVKSDWLAGPYDPEHFLYFSGNLFLQIREANPFRKF